MIYNANRTFEPGISDWDPKHNRDRCMSDFRSYFVRSRYMLCDCSVQSPRNIESAVTHYRQRVSSVKGEEESAVYSILASINVRSFQNVYNHVSP